MPRVSVSDYSFPGGWSDPTAAGERVRFYCGQLEEGKILDFPAPPFEFPAADREFLLSQKQSGLRVHKNVSYRPRQDVLRGDAADNPDDLRRLHDVMRDFSRHIVEFATRFLAPYAPHWTIDFASYRPVEEQGRDLSLHKRNDLVHVDAFPTRPTRGGRILRVFININPTQPRVWETTAGFESIVKGFGDDARLTRLAHSGRSPARRALRVLSPIFKTIGLKATDASAYDRYMLRLHDHLKESSDYQQKWEKTRLEFAPNSVWLVYTDQVPHAVMSGQFALEQTFIIPIRAMVAPEHSPLRVLESRYGTPMAV